MQFSDLNLNKPLLNALGDLGFTTPTAIQTKVFSPLMAGKDVVGISQTGTGKTFAYLLPMLRLWKFSNTPTPQILVVVPTRELVAQVVEEAEKLCAYMSVAIVGVYGGANIRVQKKALALGADLIVGTPGRLCDLISHGDLKTKKLKRVIIDEVDEMLNLGFRTQLRNLADFLPEKRQHAMFSATMTEEVSGVIETFTNYYQRIEAAPSGAPLENIAQSAYKVQNFNTKANLLEHLLSEDASMTKVLVFVQSRKFADALFERLTPVFGETLGVIHSSKSQNFRFRTVEEFHSGTVRCLIATDLIARGLDVNGITHVFNFDLGDVPEKYIHRIGRTGRSEAKGVAIAFVSEEEKKYLSGIEELMGMELAYQAVPDSIEFSEELIPLEIPNSYSSYEEPIVKPAEPSGDAFHEKKAKNNRPKTKKVRISELKKLKYGKPIKRGAKKRGKKKKK